MGIKSSRVGLQKRNKCGELITIVAYRGALDIDVELENGTLITNKSFQSFQKGVITKPSECRVGKEATNKKGLLMKIIKYSTYNNIDIQFEDGVIVRNRTYEEFLDGRIKKPEDRIGQKSVNCEGYEMEIIKYYSSTNISVRFSDGNIIDNVEYGTFKSGSVSNPYHKTAVNVGYFGVGKYKAKISGKMTKSYNTWRGMLDRCYNEKIREQFPTYKDVTVCDEWHNFQNFAQWYEDNYNPEYMKDWHLDKDIICKECKTYSPETCAFVPKEINNCILVKTSHNKSYIGITLCYKKYVVRAPSVEGRKEVGRYSDRNVAESAYKVAKIKYIRYLADKWKDKINKKVYDALYNWET